MTGLPPNVIATAIASNEAMKIGADTLVEGAAEYLRRFGDDIAPAMLCAALRDPDCPYTAEQFIGLVAHFAIEAAKRGGE